MSRADNIVPYLSSNPKAPVILLKMQIAGLFPSSLEMYLKGDELKEEGERHLAFDFRFGGHELKPF